MHVVPSRNDRPSSSILEQVARLVRRVVCGLSIGKRAMTHLYVAAYDHLPDGPFKIGRSGDAHRRLRDLEASHIFKVVVHATFPQRGCLERFVHERLSAYKVEGYRTREWFSAPLPVILQVIAEVMQQPHEPEVEQIHSTNLWPL